MKKYDGRTYGEVQSDNKLRSNISMVFFLIGLALAICALTTGSWQIGAGAGVIFLISALVSPMECEDE